MGMKKTLGALVVFGGLLGAYAYVRSIPEKGEPAARFTPIPHIKADDVAKIQIAKEGEKVVLVRVDGENFRTAEPVDYPADKSAVKTLLEKLGKLQFGDRVTDKAEKHAEFEVDDEKGVHVMVYEKSDADKPRADFYVGAMKDGYTMLRAAGKNDVVQVVGAIKSIFGRDLKGWRDKSILDFKREEAERIEVDSPAGRYVLVAEAKAPDSEPPSGHETHAKKTAWKLDTTPIVVDSLDDDVPSGIVTALAGLKAADFADGIKLDEAGLENPAWTISVGVKGGATHRLLVGNKKGDQDTYVKVPDKPQVFLIKKYTVDRIARRPIDLRDKTVTSFKDDDIEEVEIVKAKDRLLLHRASGSWTSTPSTKLDDVKVKSAVSALAGLKAIAFSDISDPKKTGLGKPEGVVTVRLRDKSKVALRVGAEAEDNTVYLVRDGRPDVFLIKKYTVERFLKKREDLEKKDSGKN